MGSSGCLTPEDADSMPPATQSGANTMGCLIDGVEYYHDTYDQVELIFYGRPLTADVYNDSILSLNFKLHDGKKSLHISFNLCGAKTGTYVLQSSHMGDGPLVAYNNHLAAQEACGYGLGSGGMFTVSITHFDVASKIVSGTFSGVLSAHRVPQERTCKDPVEFTDGRFDVVLRVNGF